jgi:hypothetical protein
VWRQTRELGQNQLEKEGGLFHTGAVAFGEVSKESADMQESGPADAPLGCKAATLEIAAMATPSLA